MTDGLVDTLSHPAETMRERVLPVRPTGKASGSTDLTPAPSHDEKAPASSPR